MNVCWNAKKSREEGKVKIKTEAFGQTPSHVPDVFPGPLQVRVIERPQLDCVPARFNGIAQPRPRLVNLVQFGIGIGEGVKPAPAPCGLEVEAVGRLQGPHCSLEPQKRGGWGGSTRPPGTQIGDSLYERQVGGQVISRDAELPRGSLSVFLQQALPCQCVPASGSDQSHGEDIRLQFHTSQMLIILSSVSSGSLVGVYSCAR